MRFRQPALAFLMLGIAPISAAAWARQSSNPPNAVTLRVAVVSATTGDPVGGVTLRLRTIPEASVVTDTFGRAAFVGVPKRMEAIEATHAEFESRTEVLLLEAGETRSSR